MAPVARRKNPHAVAMGRKGGPKGGKARWRDVPPEERSNILRRAAQARWAKAKRKKAAKA
jgi:acyl-CoA reductase-like NAD-dependent aldehyde dehydrogenase